MNEANHATQQLRGILQFYNAGLKGFVRAIRQNWIIVLLGILTGIGICIYTSVKFKGYNTVKVTYEYHILHKKIYGDWIYNLNELVKANKTEELAKVLNISFEKASAIKQVTATNIVNSPLHEDLTELYVPFYVTIAVYNPQHASTYVQTISDFMNNESIAVVKMEESRKDKTERLVFLQQQDSMINKALQTLRGGASVKETSNNPGMLFELKERYFNEKRGIERELSKNKALSVFYIGPEYEFLYKTWLFSKGSVLFVFCLTVSSIIALGRYLIKP